jgi:hypothetical protein
MKNFENFTILPRTSEKQIDKTTMYNQSQNNNGMQSWKLQ